MRSEPEIAQFRALDRVDKTGVVMPAIQKAERRVVRRLEPNFQREPFFFRNIREEIENAVSERVGPGADRQSYEFRTADRGPIRLFERVEGRVRIGRRLKIGDKLIGLEPALQLTDSVVYLRVDLFEPEPSPRTEAHGVAKYAPASADRSVDIRA